MPTTIILSIGDELVLGQTVDTNSAWLSGRLAALGFRPLAHVTVADDRAAIADAIRHAAGRCDVLLVTGGLGPTDDDLTRDALADVLAQPLELVPEALDNVERFFRALRRPMPERNKVQAMLPRGTRMIENTNGTAPGIACAIEGSAEGSGFRVQGSGTDVVQSSMFDVRRSTVRGEPGTSNVEHRTSNVERPSSLNPEPRTLNPLCRVFITPGVPKEMKVMFERSIEPELRALAAGRCILSRTLHTFGLGESAVAEKLGPLMARDRNPSVGTTVSNGFVSLRLNAYCDDRATGERDLAATEAACRAALGEVIWGADDQTLPGVLLRLLTDHPVARRWAPALCTAESCTGGLLAKLITDVPGSSACFRQGWVTYHNEAKRDQLNVSPQTLAAHGAVSEPVVREMALGAVRLSGAPYALAISGVAGPSGGTPAKPVGTVCIALAHPSADDPAASSVVARTFLLHGDREMVRDRSAKMALTMLRFHLLGQPMPF